MKLYVCLAIAVAALRGQTSPEALRRYVPVLDSIKARFWKFDPAVGYGVRNIGAGVYVLADNAYQPAFLVTNEGVIVFDAPPDFAGHISEAVARIRTSPSGFSSTHT